MGLRKADYFIIFIALLVSSISTVGFWFNIKDLTNLTDYRWWMLSTIAQVNSALLGLIFVAVSLSVFVYGRKTKLLFEKSDFLILSLLTGTLTLNIILSLYYMAPMDISYIKENIVLIFGLEIFSLMLLYGFLIYALDIFEDLGGMISKEKKSEMASNLDFRFSDSANKAILKLVNRGEEIFNIKGSVVTSKGHELLINRDGLGGRFDSDNNWKIENIIKDIEPKETIRFDVELEFECPKDEEHHLKYQFTAEQRGPGQKKLHFIDRPKIIN